MNQNEINKIENLYLDLQTNLNILRSAVTNDDSELTILDLVDFIEQIYQISTEIGKIFSKFN